MDSRSLRSYLELTRIWNSALAAACAGSMIFSLGADLGGLILGSLSVLLITSAGNCLNDLRDLEIDRINRPWRPLPSGRITPRNASLICWILFPAGMLISSLLGLEPLIIAGINSSLLLIYNHLKRYPLIPHVIIAYLSSSVFLYGSTIAMGFGQAISNPLVLSVMGGAFLINLPREFLKSIQDAPGDSAHGIRSLASLKPQSELRNLSNSLALGSCLIVPIPGMFLENQLGYLIPAALGLAAILWSCAEIDLEDSIRALKMASGLIGAGIWIGCL